MIGREQVSVFGNSGEILARCCCQSVQMAQIHLYDIINIIGDQHWLDFLNKTFNYMSVSNNSNLTYQRYNDPNSQFRTILPSQVSYSTVINHVNPNIPLRTIEEPLTQTFHEPPPKTTMNAIPSERYVRILPQPIAQHKIIEEQRIIQPKAQGQKRASTTQRPIDDDPLVQTVRGSDLNYYSNYQYKPKPPKETFHEKQRKSFCAPWLLGLLGFLALAGLITAIVLAINANQQYNSNSDISKSGIASQTVIKRQSQIDNDKTVSSSSLPPYDDASITVQKAVLNKTKIQGQNSITSSQAALEFKQKQLGDLSEETSTNQQPITEKPLTVEPIPIASHGLAYEGGTKKEHHHLQLHKIIE